jgi:hypothetical protein
MLVSNEERLKNKGGEEDWWVTSMPKLRYWLGVEHVNIIKLDCEGCEVCNKDHIVSLRYLRHKMYLVPHILFMSTRALSLHSRETY